ncbi:MAG: Uma2 family endonuclease [Chloroflexi bacterium]|nr:Uma2 family endonuclease [Chloroflexota bacterium]
MAVERVQQMSVEEFLDFAERSEEWYEYIDGELRLMTGAKLDHFAIIANIGLSLGRQLMDTDCTLLGSGMLVKAGERRFVAPDVSVVRGEPATESDTRVLLNPILVVEVTSPTSIDYDRGAKLEYYFDVASLQTYLIVDQHRVFVELHTRSETGWNLQRFKDLEDEAPLETLDCVLPIREIYQSIRLESE